MVRTYFKIGIVIVALFGIVSTSCMEAEGTALERELIQLVNTAQPKVLQGFLVYRQATGNLQVNVEDENGLQPLHHAVIRGDVQVIEILIGAGANINAAIREERERRSSTPCCRCENGELFRYLVSKGADIHLTDGLGNLPVHHAITRGMRDLIASLSDQRRGQYYEQLVNNPYL